MASTPDILAAELEKVRRHIRVLVEVSRLGAQTGDLAWFLDQLVVQVARAVEIDHVKVLKYRRQTADLLIAAGFGWKPGSVGSTVLPANLLSPPGRSFQTAEPVVIQNFDDQPDYALSDFLKEHGIVSLANVPVLIGGAAWGVVEVDSTRPRDFTHDTIEFLMAIGALIGSFIRNHPEESHEDAMRARVTTEVRNGEVLLREMQHRVKNNFQLILSSIQLQKRRQSAPEVHRALDHVASRINAISLAHDQLAPRQGGQVVKLSGYLHALCNSIKQQVDGIDIDVQADELELTIDRAVPLGLILNEAATNSIKHAFDQNGGTISVRLEGAVAYGEGRLTIADSGRGMGNFKSGGSGSGLGLIESLAHQIGGTVEQTSDAHGTTTCLRFPIIA